MPRPKPPPPSRISFVEACDRLADVLSGSARREIVRAALGAGEASAALARLRIAMRAHAFPTATGSLSFRRMVDQLSARAGAEGLHVMEGWDYREHRFPDDIVPVLLLDYCSRAGIPDRGAGAALAVLLDHYFLSALALVALRAWDTGDPSANLDRVSALLRDLHGPQGSGHRVVDDAETLLMLAIAYYNPDEPSFGLLLDKVRALDGAHQLRVALPCAGILGGHLRWGLRFMYRRDAGAMRDDNAVDYPWLLFALLTLMQEYARTSDAPAGDAGRERVVEALLGGLSPDPWAFTGAVPRCLAEHRTAHDELRQLLARHGDGLLADVQRHQPAKEAYSPLAFSCNFLSNAAVATTVIAIGDASAGAHPSLNALLTRQGAGTAPDESAERFASRLMAFSSGAPERLGAGGAPLIVYDPYDAVHALNAVVRTLSPASRPA